jgi:hypothetical protein
MGHCKFGGKDFKKEYAKKQIRDRANLRKETLKNRKEHFKSKVLRKDLEVRF